MKLFSICFTLLLFLGGNISFSQPCFTASPTRGCVPFKVNIIDCSTTGSQIIYNYGANNITQKSKYTTSTTFTYTATGFYSITQLGNFNGKGDSVIKKQFIQVLSTFTPTPLIEKCADRKVRIVFAPNQYDQYLIDWGDGNSKLNAQNFISPIYQYADLKPRNILMNASYNDVNCGVEANFPITPLENLATPRITKITENVVNNSSEHIVYFNISQSQERTRYKIQNSVSTSQNVFRGFIASNQVNEIRKISLPNNPNTQINVKVYDTCGKEINSSFVPLLYINGEAKNGFNTIKFPDFITDSIFSLSLLKNNILLKDFTSLDPNNSFFNDNEVVCGSNYFYQWRLTFGKQAIVSISDSISLKAISKTAPQKPKDIFATVIENQVQLNWKSTNNETYYILSSKNGAQFSLLDTVTSVSKYIDTQNNPSNTALAYKLYLQNSCKLQSEISTVISPVFVKYKIDNQYKITFDWSPIGSDLSLLDYTIEQLDEQKNVITQYNSSLLKFTEPTADTLNQVAYFRIKSNIKNNQNLSESSYSNLLEIKKEALTLIPNAFTPNKDGLNDTFRWKTYFIKSLKLELFDRWGAMVFSTSQGKNEWDGLIAGVEAIPEVYTYKISSTDLLGNTKNEFGYVSLIK